MIRIALIGFGGTIAMVPNDKGSLVPAKTAEDLVEHAPGLKELGADLDVIQLSNKDSTNLTPCDWQALIQKIVDIQEEYDGFIITHGTDTMSYTATATAFALGKNLNKPVVFTGSQLPIVDPGTDAQVNLERSMKTVLDAKNMGISEVMVVFSDKILRAARCIKTSESRFDAFESPAFPHLGDLIATGTIFHPLSLKNPTSTQKHEIKNNFETRIISIDVRPGLEPEVLKTLSCSDKCLAIILKSLGAGNVPSEGKYSLLPVIKETVANGKPVIIATKFVGGKTVPHMYEPGQAALDAGAGHSGDMTDVAAEVKLMWLLGQGITEPDAVKRAMLTDYIGEIS